MALTVNNVLKGNRDKDSQDSEPGPTNSNTNEQSDSEYYDDKIPDKPYILNSLYYLFIILFVGAPMWFYTCSVTRYSLPNLDELENRLGNSNNSLPKLHLDISLVQFPKDRHLTNYLRTNLSPILQTELENVTYNIGWRVRRPTDQEVDMVQLHIQQYNSNKDFQQCLCELEANLLRIHKPSNRFRLHMYLVNEKDYPSFCHIQRIHTYTLGFERLVFLCPSMALTTSNDYSSTVTLIETVLHDVYSKSVNTQRIMAMISGRIDLLFSLLPESGLDNLDSLSEIADWIHNIYDKNVKTKYPELKELVDIRVITQYIFDLLDEDLLRNIVIKPQIRDTNNTGGEDSLARIIKIDQLHQLFHKFESRISKHSAQNVHNVVFVIPNSSQQPIVLKHESNNLNLVEGQDESTMVIFKDKKSLVLNLRALFRRILGLSSPNICDNCLVRRDIFFNRWEIDALMGALLVAKLQNALISLRAIKHQVVGVKIPKDVSMKASEAYKIALEAINQLEKKDTLESYRLASRSYELSEIAFYDPSLLESLYFPDEFKYAIYLPLFLPLALPFIMSMNRMFKALIKFLTARRKDTKLKIN